MKKVFFIVVIGVLIWIAGSGYGALKRTANARINQIEIYTTE